VGLEELLDRQGSDELLFLVHAGRSPAGVGNRRASVCNALRAPARCNLSDEYHEPSVTNVTLDGHALLYRFDGHVEFDRYVR